MKLRLFIFSVNYGIVMIIADRLGMVATIGLLFERKREREWGKVLRAHGTTPYGR